MSKVIATYTGTRGRRRQKYLAEFNNVSFFSFSLSIILCLLTDLFFYFQGGCADIWNPKSIRAGAGGHFKIPIISGMNFNFTRILMFFSINVLLFRNTLAKDTFHDSPACSSTPCR